MEEQTKIKCEICGKDCSNSGVLSRHLSKEHPGISKQYYYDTYLKIYPIEGICPTCGKPTVFLNIKLGYRAHCSTSCATLDPEVIQKSKDTRLDRYGDENFRNYAQVQQTMLERYGETNYSKTSEGKAKISNAAKMRTTDDWTEILVKQRATKLELYGDQNYNNVTKIKATKLQRYNDSSYTNKEQANQTKLKKYGDTNYNNREKYKNTCLENYGVTNVSQLEEVKEKSRQTCLAKYGVEYSFQSVNNKEKSKETCLLKYSVPYVSQVPEVKNKIKQTNSKKIDHFSQINNCIPVINLIHQYSQSWYKNKIVNLVVDPVTHFNFVKIEDIPKIEKWYLNTKKETSSLEQLVEEEIRKFYSGEIIKTRKVLYPEEIDLYFPELKVGIECNGTYWHSSLMKNKDYHYNKSIKASELGIRLIHIYEYEWYNPELQPKIISLLKIALKAVDTKIYARNCKIKQISNKEAKSFNDKNHLQGHRNAQVTYGLFYNNELVQLMSFSKTKYNRNIKDNNSWEIIRGCPGSNNIVIGGVSKLFKHFIKDYKPEVVFSYCDFNKFDGSGYKKLGMQFIGYTSPDMKWWLKSGDVVNRSPKKHKELKENSVAQIWGAGSKKYIIDFRNKNNIINGEN